MISVRTRIPTRALLAGSVLLAALFPAHAQTTLVTEIPQTRFSSGQDIVPTFEGWLRNPDGTFTMVFGYLNRNWKEELIIPPGSDNNVDPGGPDRGQPTYFLPRRQRFLFRVQVPADWGQKELIWTITAHGRTEKAYAHLLPGRGDHRTYDHDARESESRRRRSQQTPVDHNRPRVGRECKRPGNLDSKSHRRRTA